MDATTIYSVAGMTCMGCVANVKKTIEAMEGVSHVIVDLTLNRAFIQAKLRPKAADIQKLLGEKYRVETLEQDKITVPVSEVDHHNNSDHLNVVDSPWNRYRRILL